MNYRSTWSKEEDKVIQKLVEKLGFKSWANISVQLNRIYGTVRSGKQCRQRWHNHLNPSIQKKSWTKKDQEKLFNLHQQYGNKWTVISQLLPGRTDNSIKNYFYSTIRRSLRRIGKMLGSKNSTDTTKDIKPSTLSKIFAADSELVIDEKVQSEQQQKLIKYIKDNSLSVRATIFKFTSYKPKKDEMAAQEDRNRLQDVIQKMVHINQIYQKLRVEEQKKRKVIFKGKRPSQDSDDQMELDQLKSEEMSEEHIRNIDHLVEKIGEKQKKNVSIKKEDNGQIKLEPILDTKPLENPFVMVPTAKFKHTYNPAHQFDSESIKDYNSILDNPPFFLQLKDEEIPLFHRNSSSLSMESPGFFFQTPSNNPFNYFQTAKTPQTPQPLVQGSLASFSGIQNSSFDECQMKIKKQIESNMKGQGIHNTTTSIGNSPAASAFSFCFM